MDGWMYVCMYACIYVYVYVCVYVYIHTYVHAMPMCTNPTFVFQAIGVACQQPSQMHPSKTIERLSTLMPARSRHDTTPDLTSRLSLESAS